MTVANVLERWEPVIGLEVHCQLKTASKMFTACGFTFGADPNTLTDPYTLGLPGTLPVPNRTAVMFAIRLALAVNAQIHTHSRFARKHYFYPDLPKGYQISQSDAPYATGGGLEVVLPRTGERTFVRLVRVHLEEDAGKNLHLLGDEVSLVDFNRAGVPLIEIVSEPDIRSAEQAGAYVRELRTLIRYLGISDANMEEGTLRCDANVSLRARGTEVLGTRCEIKNLNSFKFLEQAILAEIRRQADILGSGGNIVQSTLSYDTAKDVTRVMRSKEEAADYRYFPEPDLPPLVIETEWIDAIRDELPELPAARRQRYRELGLSSYDAGVLTADQELAEFFDAIDVEDVHAKKACNWLTVELLGRLHADERTIRDSPVKPPHVAEIVMLIEQGKISGRNAKDVFDACYREGLAPREIVEREGYTQVSDTSVLESVIADVLREHPVQFAQYRAGKHALKGFFVGHVMKRTNGQANAQLVQQLLDTALGTS